MILRGWSARILPEHDSGELHETDAAAGRILIVFDTGASGRAPGSPSISASIAATTRSAS